MLRHGGLSYISSLYLFSENYFVIFFNHFSPADQRNCSSNSEDPDETAHNEPSHQDLYCLPFSFDFGLGSLFGSMVLTRFKGGKVHVRNSGMKELKA